METQLQIQKAAEDSQVQAIADLAAVIWAEHFTPIIGEKQVELAIGESYKEAGVKIISFGSLGSFCVFYVVFSMLCFLCYAFFSFASSSKTTSFTTLI